jgi:hypothetical protein
LASQIKLSRQFFGFGGEEQLQNPTRLTGGGGAKDMILT